MTKTFKLNIDITEADDATTFSITGNAPAGLLTALFAFAVPKIVSSPKPTQPAAQQAPPTA